MNWGVFPLCLALFIYSFVQKDWSWGVENNSLFRKQKWSFGLILIIVIDTTNTILASWAVIMTFKYAILSQTNQGVIQTLFSLSSVFLCIIGRIVFHERMRHFHYVGIILLIGCSILISFSDDSSKAKSFEI